MTQPQLVHVGEAGKARGIVAGRGLDCFFSDRALLFVAVCWVKSCPGGECHRKVTVCDSPGEHTVLIT